MLTLLLDHYPLTVGGLIALILIFWPPTARPKVEAKRRERLAELDAGAPERYFEERRSLETYGPKSAGPYRLWGVLLLILIAISFALARG